MNMKKRAVSLILACLFVLGLTLPSYAMTSFWIDRVEYRNGTASVYSSVRSDAYPGPAGKEVILEIRNEDGASMVDPVSRVAGSEPTSVSGEVYSYSLDPVSFIPTADSVAYTVYASIDESVVGTDMVVPGTSNYLTLFSIDGQPADVSQGTRRIMVLLPGGTPAGEHRVEFTHDGSYVRMNGSIVTSGSRFSFTDSAPGDREWDSVAVAVYGENNSENTYTLSITTERLEADSCIVDWKFVNPVDNSPLTYADRHYLYYKGVPGKEVAKVRVQLREGSSVTVTGEFRVRDRTNPEEVGEKYADCGVERESDTVYYLSVDVRGIAALPYHSEASPSPEQFVMRFLEDGAVARGRPREPIVVVNANPRRAPFLSEEGSYTTDWATEITNYADTDVPLILHTVGKGKITFDPGLDLTRSETMGNLKDIGPMMMESYGRIELDALEGSAFQNGATLEMYGLPFTEMPDIIDDSDAHGVIGSVTYRDGTLTFRVDGFTTYVAQPRLSVNDLPASTTAPTATVSGAITDPQATVTITVGGVDQGAVEVNPTTGAFSKTVSLSVGSNTISVDAAHEGFGYDLAPVVKTITRRASGGGGSDAGTGGTGGASAGTTRQPTIKVGDDGGVTVETSAPSMDSTGTAAVELTEDTLDNALEQATAGTDGVKTVQVVIPAAGDASSYKPQIPADLVTAETEGEVVSEKIQFKTEIADLTVPNNMLGLGQATGAQNVAISIARADTSDLDPELRARIGDKPVIELGLEIDGEPADWDNPDAPVTVSIPYTPTAEELEDPEHIVVWYIDGNGNITAVPTGRYDPATGRVMFQVTHFSMYAVVYAKKTFDDIGSCPWAQKQIEVLASRGVINGTSETTFSPGSDITRADLVVLLVKALGLSAGVSDNFDDVSPSAYYYREVGVARKLGIASGTGGDRFDPLAPVTRQDMMTLIARALAVAKKALTAGSDADLDAFLDRSLVAPYAVESVGTLVRNGLVVGSNNLIDPLGNATRAEAAVIIYRAQAR